VGDFVLKAVRKKALVASMEKGGKKKSGGRARRAENSGGSGPEKKKGKGKGGVMVRSPLRGREEIRNFFSPSEGKGKGKKDGTSLPPRGGEGGEHKIIFEPSLKKCEREGGGLFLPGSVVLGIFFPKRKEGGES